MADENEPVPSTAANQAEDDETEKSFNAKASSEALITTPKKGSSPDIHKNSKKKGGVNKDGLDNSGGAAAQSEEENTPLIDRTGDTNKKEAFNATSDTEGEATPSKGTKWGGRSFGLARSGQKKKKKPEIEGSASENENSANPLKKRGWKSFGRKAADQQSGPSGDEEGKEKHQEQKIEKREKIKDESSGESEEEQVQPHRRQQPHREDAAESAAGSDIDPSTNKVLSLEVIYDSMNGLVFIFAILALQVLCVNYGMCNYPNKDPAVPSEAKGILPSCMVIIFVVVVLGSFSIHSNNKILVLMNTVVELASFLFFLVYSSMFLNRARLSEFRSDIEQAWKNGTYSSAAMFYYELPDQLADQRYTDLTVMGSFAMVTAFLLLFKFVLSLLKMKKSIEA
mmetsp:Transcript_40106/g.59090  ORF Transcript_40106/g.59090 Transcript_40106/m.59090 type:complete len:397 (+) Transcript_40106:32-1222(+)